MSTADVAAAVVHLGFAGLWSGSVLFLTLAVLPIASGDEDAAILARAMDRLRTVSRISALALLVTGGHMAAARYTAESLTGSPRGHLVLTMVALWVLLAALVEVAGARVSDDSAETRDRTAAAAVRPLLYAASVVAVLLLVDAGLLAGGLP